MIKLKIRFLSIYSDYARDYDIETTNTLRIRDLVIEVVTKYPILKHIFNKIKPIILYNGLRVNEEYVVSSSGELAFIPPVSGG